MSKIINVGRVTSYADAVAGGYQGTREEWEIVLANLGTTAAEVEANRQAVADDKAAVEENLTTVESYKNSAVQSASEALQSAESAHTDALAATAAKEAAQTAQGIVEEAKEAAVSAKEAAENAQTEANQSASAAAGSALVAGNAAQTATNQAGAASESAAAAAASAASVSGVVQEVTAAKTEAISAIETKGAETLDSIPDDYTELSGDVADLKSAFEDFKDATFDEIPCKNLYNPAEKEAGICLRSNNGTTGADSGFDTTAYLPVTPGKYLTFSRYTSGKYVAYSVPSYAFYSDESTSGYISGGTYETNILVPENANYARVCTHANPVDFQVELTDDGVFTSYEAWHKPTYDLDENIDIPIDQISGNLAVKIDNVSVKGSNLIPISPNGVGAYYLNGAVIKYEETNTTFHYAIVPLKQNTRYFVNSEPRWWILTDNDDNVISGAQYFSPRGKRYIDSGLATRLYYTVDNNSWNTGVIIAEGISGRRDNIQQTSLLKPINQLAADGWYACALPKVTIKFTVGINEKFYYKNILSLPNINTIIMSVNGVQTAEEDGVVIPITATGAFKNYLYTVFDQNLSIVEQNVNGKFGARYADNVSNCSALLIGDNTIVRDSAKIGQTLLDAFAARNKTITLLGTRGSGDNKNEGRSGWSAADYCRKEKIGGVTNAFYNPATEGFDFSYYMTNQNYESVDFVVIQLGINDLYNVSMYTAKTRIDTLITDMTTIINSIHAFNPDQKIILNLPTPCTAKTTGQYAMPTVQQKTIRAKFIYYNALMEVLSTGFKNVRCSHCHLILDPETEIADLIHPTTAGLEKMGMETLSQINCWQNA